MKKLFLSIAVTVCAISTLAFAENASDTRWHINAEDGITWKAEGTSFPHYDHIEMAGRKVATVVRYGIDEKGAFYLNRGMVWPMLRTIPNNTHASLMRHFGNDITSKIMVNRWTLQDEKVKEISLNGIMTVVSEFPAGVRLTRTLFPSVDKPIFCEKYTLANISQHGIQVELPSATSTIQTRPEEGVYGSYKLIVRESGGTKNLNPGEAITFGVTIEGYKPEEKEFTVDIQEELEKREQLVKLLSENLVLETPDPVLNTAFKFAKIRASESIYETKGGFLHGPGGESYYAAIWANDQAEYVNPFFPFLGYPIGNESAMVAYKHFARFMNDEYKPIPSSIIAEGDDIWNGVGDRGDAAMIAYGASRYALTLGDKAKAEELWPLIEWCLEYCHRKLNSDGVVTSNCDELEGRFPAGDANLCTSSLYYDALLSTAWLAENLGKDKSIPTLYRQQAADLRKAIDKYFSAKVEGFDTYQYYKGNDLLRSWICIPLCMGIDERKDGTIAALFSPQLWCQDGVLTQSGSKTFWDRSTLYAMRGVLSIGETDKVIDHLEYYSKTRLLGEHVPYPVEAWPEGSQRHLSAESGLYCRIFTEGLFGIRPTGLDSFQLIPRLPKDWDQMELNHIRTFGKDIDISVKRINADTVRIWITNEGHEILFQKVPADSTVNVNF